MRYEDMVRRFCGDDWKTVNYEERLGGLGVACVISFLKGVKPTLEEMSRHLNIHPNELEPAFLRLYRHNVFTSWDIKKNNALMGKTTDYDAQTMWCHIAALSSGFVGMPNLEVR